MQPLEGSLHRLNLLPHVTFDLVGSWQSPAFERSLVLAQQYPELARHLFAMEHLALVAFLQCMGALLAYEHEYLGKTWRLQGECTSLVFHQRFPLQSGTSTGK